MDLLFVKRASPSRYEAGLAYCAPALRYDIGQELIRKLIHDRPIGMVRGPDGKRLGGHAITLALFTVADGAIRDVECSTFSVILYPPPCRAYAGKRQESEKRDDPVNQIQTTFNFAVFSYYQITERNETGPVNPAPSVLTGAIHREKRVIGIWLRQSATLRRTA